MKLSCAVIMSASCAIQNVKQRKLEDIEGVIRRLNVKTIQVPEEKDKNDSGREKNPQYTGN
jgi:hypothetical protein